MTETESVAVRIPVSMKREIVEEVKKDRHVSVSDFIRDAVRAKLERMERKNKKGGKNCEE